MRIKKQLIFCLLVTLMIVGSLGTIGVQSADAAIDNFIKFDGSILATDYVATEPAGVTIWNPNGQEYYAFSELGGAEPRSGQGISKQGFTSLNDVDPGSITIEIHDMGLNNEETYNPQPIDPENLLWREQWEGGMAYLKVNGEVIATSNDLTLKAVSQISKDNLWYNQIIKFRANGHLQASAGSELGLAFVNEFTTLFGSTAFEMIFFPVAGHDDLQIASQPLVQSNNYEFLYTTLLTGDTMVAAAINEIAQLPAVDQLTLANVEQVEGARGLVDQTILNGATLDDISNLNLLVAAEAKINELAQLLVSNLAANYIRDTGLTLTWNAPVGGSEGYFIFLNGVHNTSVNNTVWNPTGLTADTQYTITVKTFEEGFNGVGKSITIRTTTPVWLSHVSHDHDSVALSWQAPQDPQSVQLQYATYSSFVFAESIDIQNGETTTTVTGLESDTTYYFRLSVAGGPNNAFTNTVEVTTDSAPAEPADLDNDQDVDRNDLEILADWYGTSNVAGDLNGDGKVNLFDLVILSRKIQN